MVRRLVDIVLAGIVLVASLPVTLTAAVAIYAVNPGSVIYRATRVGKSGRPFTMYKLRTMYVRGRDTGSVVTAVGDGRVFPLGRWLRRLKLDELPQMVNIIKGDMTFVGPRPRDPKIVEQCYTPLHRETLEVLPGLTSPGTLFYLTSGEPTLPARNPETEYQARVLPRKLALDIDYVRNRTSWVDVRIAIRTIGAIFNVRRAGLDDRDVERVAGLIEPPRGGDGASLSVDAGGMDQSPEARNGDQEDLRDR